MEPRVIDSYKNVKIVETIEGTLPKYILIEPDFTPEERRIADDPRSLLKDFKRVIKDLEKLHYSEDEKEKYLRDYVKKEIAENAIPAENVDRLTSLIMDQIFFKYTVVGDLMRDDNLEEIMINGVNSLIYVVHRKHGMCVTNLKYESLDTLNEFISWIKSYVNRELSQEKPLLDAHLPDGSRVNVAIPPAAPYGPSVTIRKFKKVPFNIVELIEMGTISAELAAFLWVCVEGFGVKPCDILIAGGAGSGKTTLLNALAMFIPKTERVVTVEDTLELNFSFVENWVPLEAKPSLYERSNELDMHALLKNSLRMRPDRVIVGEVRGPEAETLLVAMDIGLSGSMGTIHANNARETTIRLMESPMSVPVRMIPLIDMIVVLNRIYDRKKGMFRRITEVSEISGVEKQTVQMGEIYHWDMNTDVIERTEYPILLKEKIAKNCGINKKRLDTELYIREKILQYLVANGIKDNRKVIGYFQRYHVNPKSVIDEIKATVE